MHELHLWDHQAIRDLLWLIGIAAVLWLGYLASIVTVPLLIGLLLAYLVEPLLAIASRLHPALTRVRVVSALVALLVTGLLAAVVLVVPAVIGQTERLMTDRGRYAAGLERLAAHEQVPEAVRPAIMRVAAAIALESPASEAVATEAADDEAANNLPSDAINGVVTEAQVRRIVSEELARAKPVDQPRSPVEIATQALRVVGGVIGGVFAIVLGVFLTLFFFVAFAVAWPSVLAYFRDCIPPASRDRALELARSMDGVVSGFVRGRLIICSLLSVLFMVGWWLVDVPHALLLGLVTGMANLVPYLSALGILAAWGLVVAAATSDPASMPLYANADGLRWMMVLILPGIAPAIGQILDDYILTPQIQGRATKLSTPAVVAAVVAGGAIAGLYGMLLAIPVAGCARILLLEVVAPRLRDWWNTTPVARL